MKIFSMVNFHGKTKMNIDTLYFIAIAEASENDETDYALALSIFYRLLKGGEDVVIH